MIRQPNQRQAVRVTVGIPFYNAESTLLEAIRSVFAQTLSDWELILLDDGSTDRSLKIAQSISDSRVTVRTSSSNQGLVWSLNEISQMARGEYLARMDADDLMHPQRLERQLQFLDTHPAVQVIGSGVYVIDAAGRPNGIRGQHPPDTAPASVLTRNLIIHPTITGRTAWFRSNPYDASYPRAEDHELWCRTCKQTSFGHIAEPLMLVRNAASGNVRKYAETCRSDRRIFRKYGPAHLGRMRTAAMMAGAYAKPLVYALLTRMSLESRLLGLRNASISKEQMRAANAVLQSIASVDVPRV